MFLFVLFRMLLRRDWAAAVLLTLIYTVLTFLQMRDLGLSSAGVWLYTAAVPVMWGAGLFVLLRFGFLAAAVALVYMDLLIAFPITPHVSAWYSGIGLAGLVVLLGLAGYGFYTSLGGQPLFGRVSLEDER